MNYENMTIAELQAEKEAIDRAITKQVTAQRLKKYATALQKVLTDIENADIELCLLNKGDDLDYEIEEISFDTTNNKIIISIF
jgi:molecular chaperone DnaK (HSP70)